MAKIKYHDGTEFVTVTGVDLEQGIDIEDIEETAEWKLRTTDDSPATYTTDFSGGRPNDRE